MEIRGSLMPGGRQVYKVCRLVWKGRHSHILGKRAGLTPRSARSARSAATCCLMRAAGVLRQRRRTGEARSEPGARQRADRQRQRRPGRGCHHRHLRRSASRDRGHEARGSEGRRGAHPGRDRLRQGAHGSPGDFDFKFSREGPTSIQPCLFSTLSNSWKTESMTLKRSTVSSGSIAVPSNRTSFDRSFVRL